MINCSLNQQADQLVCGGAWQSLPAPDTGKTPRLRDDQPTRTVAIRFGRVTRWTVPVDVNTHTPRRK